MSTITDEQVKAAVRAAGDIPASNPGYISFAPQNVRMIIAHDLLEKIVRAALTAAAQAGKPGYIADADGGVR